MSVINKYILFVKYFIEKRALSLCISFIDLLTRRNIEQTPGQLRRHCRLVPLRRCCYPERRQRSWWRHLQRLKRSDYDRGIDGGDINDDLDGDGEERPNINETGKAGDDNGSTDVEDGAEHVREMVESCKSASSSQLCTDVALLS